MRQIRALKFVAGAAAAALVAWMAAGCSENVSDPQLVGRIVDKSDAGVLVVEGITLQELKTKTIAEILDTSDSYRDACYVRNKTLQSHPIGEKVELWYDGYDASYPCQTSATKIRVVKE